MTLLAGGWALSAGVMLLLWLHERRTKNATHVDVGWTLNLGAVAVFYACLAPGWFPRNLLLAMWVSAWSWRLGMHILERSHGKPEDGRYAAMRAVWGEKAGRNFFFFFQAQALLDALFSIPMLLCFMDERPGFAPQDVLALAVFAVSIVGESTADAQLEKWKSDPANKGKTCRAGLWNWSRHPNYFFEWLHWWAYPAMAFGAPYWAWTLLGPALMLLFLFKITGIPHTENQAAKSRPDYAAYQREVSMFIPWPPRKSA